jgi:hypothetical protein
MNTHLSKLSEHHDMPKVRLHPRIRVETDSARLVLARDTERHETKHTLFKPFPYLGIAPFCEQDYLCKLLQNMTYPA